MRKKFKKKDRTTEQKAQIIFKGTPRKMLKQY